ncbi:MAG: DMT family transporter [Paracoccaceae bacterium]
MAHVAPPGPPGLTNWALLLTTSVIWGSAFLGMSVALEGYPPLTVAAGRTGIGTLVLIALAFALGQMRFEMPDARGLRHLGLTGLVNIAAPFALLTWGLQHVPSAFAGVTMGAVPIFLLPLVYLFSKEEGIGPRRIGGLILGLIGLIVLVGPGAGASTGSDLEWLGRWACLGSAVCYAFGSILTRRAPAVPPVILAAAMLGTATIVLTPIALLFEGVPDFNATRASAALIYIGVMPTAVAFFLRVYIIRNAGSIFMSLVSYIVPLWAVLFGIVLLGEKLSASLFVGLALILMGIALSEWRNLVRLKGT